MQRQSIYDEKNSNQEEIKVKRLTISEKDTPIKIKSDFPQNVCPS